MRYSVDTPRALQKSEGILKGIRNYVRAMLELNSD